MTVDESWRRSRYRTTGQAGYAARAGEFGTPEKRDVDQAMADSEDKAKEIIAVVKSGKSLEEPPRRSSAMPTA